MLKLRNFLTLLAIPFMLIGSSCGNSDAIDEKEIEITYVDDNYRSIYEIFPYSFSDSNADGIGDINGIIDKFDYIKDLNYSGIWLTPVHQSDSYHKYDVDDYKSIDKNFGTLADYDNLVKKCHENNMTILLDLVLNHSSDNNEWFTKCIYDHERNKVDDQYYNYYNVVKVDSSGCPSGYTQIGNVAYESRFYSGMPDLNLGEVLKNPDGYLANDLKDIIKFWLVDHDIDGFRLDAVTSYFTGDIDKNIQFLTWLNKIVKSYKPSAYVVGEGAWGNINENQRYYTSGIDSFFMFEDALADGFIAQVLNQQDATYLPYAIDKNILEAGTGIPAPFMANHDTGRLLGSIKGKSNVENTKFATGILAMMSGTTYSYYGDEAGMAVYTGGSKVKDEDKRQPMPWGDEYQCDPVIGSSVDETFDKYPYGTVEVQLKDSSSLVNYTKKANLLRLQFPEISRGVTKKVYASDDDCLCAIKKTYKDKSIYIVVNASRTKEKTYDFTEIGGEEVVGQLVTSSYIKQSDKNVKKITIPPFGIAIIQ